MHVNVTCSEISSYTYMSRYLFLSLQAMGLSRKVIAWFFGGLLLSLALGGIRITGWFARDRGVQPDLCFNTTLIDSVALRFSPALNKALAEYASTVAQFTQQVKYDYHLAHKETLRSVGSTSIVRTLHQPWRTI